MDYRHNIPRLQPGDSVQQGYTFSYDNLSRLTSAVFASGTQAAGRFNESASYDSNGNIASLTRNATSGVIDSLAYQYRGNMMIRITDNAPAVLRDSGFVYRAPANPEDIAYTYNRNGAMISDYHRRVEIEYNLLNLPQRVTNTMDTTKSVTYSYDSGGGKLRRQAMDGGVVTSTVDYAGNKLYTDGTLSKVLIPGGYIDVSGSQASYMFFATDHLGSVRQVLDSNGAQQEQNDYYSFGMQQKRGGYLQTTTNKYKYNGKEQDKFGDFTTLDYGARFYDPAIARWNTVDPLAEDYYSLSSYGYCGGNPINRFDVNGEWIYILHEGHNYKYSNGTLYQYQTKGDNAGTYTQYTAEKGSFLAGVTTGLNNLA